MDGSQRLILTYMATGREEEVVSIASGIDQGTFTLLGVVQGLGEYLTAEENATRTKGVTLLAEVLAKCDSSKVSFQHTRVLTAFMRSKLDDFDTLLPALKGLGVLSGYEKFSDGLAVEVVESLFAHIEMKTFVQNVRFGVFKMIDRFMSNHRSALKKMGPAFIKGYTTLATGEKDPRNLILSFAIVRIILVEFDTFEAGIIEGLFDITFCYFPISFNPPPNDPYGITSEDLKGALRECLAAHPAFGPLALPMFLEKLSAATGAPKRDTLLTLSTCLPTYGRASTQEYAEKLWAAIKIEIFQPIDNETERLALGAAQALIRTLYPPSSSLSTSSSTIAESVPSFAHVKEEEEGGEGKVEGEKGEEEEALEGLVVDIVQESKKILREPEKNQAKHAIKVLGALIGTTPRIRRYVLSEGLEHILGLYSNPDEVGFRAPILAGLVGLLGAVQESSAPPSPDSSSSSSPINTSTSTSIIPPSEKPLEPYKDRLLGALMSGLSPPSTSASTSENVTALRRAALEGTYYLVKIPALLGPEELGYVTHCVDELVADAGEGDEELRPSLLRVFTAIATISTAPIISQTLPLLFSLLPASRGPARTAYAEQASYRQVLASLTTLCSSASKSAGELFDIMVVRLCARLDAVCAPRSLPEGDSAMEGGETEEGRIECDAAYAHAILSSLHSVLKTKVERGDGDVGKYVDRLGEEVWWLFLRGATSGEGKGRRGSVTAHARVIAAAAKILALLVRSIPSDRQLALVKAAFDAFSRGNPSALLRTRKLPADSAPFVPLAPDAPSAQRALIPLLAAVVNPLRKDVSLPVEDTLVAVRSLVNWSITGAETPAQYNAARHAAASIINKRVADVTDFLEKDVEDLWTKEIISPDVPLERRKRALQTYVWISKALLCRNHPDIKRWVDRLFAAFPDPEMGWDAARALGQLGAGGEGVLTKGNYAVLSILHVQKFFTATLPRVTSGCSLSSENADEQTTYLVALTSLVRAVPKSMYARDLPSMMPYLLRGLDLPDEEMRENVINTLISVAEDSSSSEGSEDILANHAGTIIAALLKNADSSLTKSPRLRETSLRCLALLPSAIKYSILHPEKRGVITRLGKALDDPKRGVRKEAVDARHNWFALSA